MFEGCGGYDEGEDDDDFGTDSWVSTGDIIKTQPAETSINNNRLILSFPPVLVVCQKYKRESLPNFGFQG